MDMADRNPGLSDAALLVRRATLSNSQELVAELAPLSWSDAVANLLGRPLDSETLPVAAETKYSVVNEYQIWWIKKCLNTSNPLQERMAWFFQTFLTTSRKGVGGDYSLIAAQLNMLRANSLGNFRDLLQAFAIDGALIKFLNANNNTAKKPNENLAREIMELFTTGFGHYTETDIREATKAMSGWRIKKDSIEVEFDPERAYQDPVTFMGETKKWDIVSIVDRLCDHPATSDRIAAMMYNFFGGTVGNKQISRTSPKAKELGAYWREQSLEIKPLVSKILNDPGVKDNYYARARTGFEFYMASFLPLNLEVTEKTLYIPRSLGQMPYEIPNVAGWPDNWLDPSSFLPRYNFIVGADYERIENWKTTTVGQMLDRCGVYKINQANLDVINSISDNGKMGEEGVVATKWRAVMNCPEMHLL